MTDDHTIKDRFHISTDELESRMEKQQKYHDQPIQRAVAILEMAVDTVLKKLGIDVTRDDIPDQMELMGIIMTEETREEMAGLNGFFIFVKKKNDIIPYAWVGQAQLNSIGECSCEIHWFQDERMDKMGGIKLTN